MHRDSCLRAKMQRGRGRLFWFSGFVQVFVQVTGPRFDTISQDRCEEKFLKGSVGHQIRKWSYACVWNKFHLKTLIEIAMVLSKNSSSFPSNSRVSVTFSILLDLGNSGILQIVRNSMLTGRWWEGQILINLCGKNNVRNCDLLQSDFCTRCRTVLRVAKGFLWRV